MNQELTNLLNQVRIRSFSRNILVDLFRFLKFIWIYLQLDNVKNRLKGSGVDIQIRAKTREVTEKEVVKDDPLDIERREKVKDAMLHAWTCYEKYAWGQDELQVSLNHWKILLINFPFLF